MKKGILFFIGFFVIAFSTTITNANTVENFHKTRTINFIENGIAFSVFTNGNFNYDTDVFLYRNGRRFRQNIIIDRDYRGRINFINNVPIRYNRWNNVTRIGNVFINYNRGRITNVGHLTISYNHFGEPLFFGNVRSNVNLNIYSGRIWSYNDPFFYRRDFRRNYTQFRSDRNFIYYRNRANNVVRRRVANNIRNNNNIIRNRKNTVRRTDNSINRNNSRNNILKKNNRNSTVTKRKTVVTRNNNGNTTRRSTSTKRRSS